mmetsp:Transcript_38436/g.62275  ORF Transcript_38436/g.62275 Transcript_38436/m.62275 type:complete len:1057 (-) Transcript_38436:485-3655(-)
MRRSSFASFFVLLVVSIGGPLVVSGADIQSPDLTPDQPLVTVYSTLSGSFNQITVSFDFEAVGLGASAKDLRLTILSPVNDRAVVTTDGTDYTTEPWPDTFSSNTSAPYQATITFSTPVSGSGNWSFEFANGAVVQYRNTNAQAYWRNLLVQVPSLGPTLAPRPSPQSGILTIQPEDLTPTQFSTQLLKQCSGTVYGFNVSFNYVAVGNASLAGSLSVRILDPSDRAIQVGGDRTDYTSLSWPGTSFVSNATGFYSAVVWFEAPMSSLSGDGTWSFLIQNYDAVYYSKSTYAANFTDIVLVLNFGGGNFWPSPSPLPSQLPEGIILSPDLTPDRSLVTVYRILSGTFDRISVSFNFEAVGPNARAKDLRLTILSPVNDRAVVTTDSTDYTTEQWPSDFSSSNTSFYQADITFNTPVSGSGNWSFEFANGQVVQYNSVSASAYWRNLTVQVPSLGPTFAPRPSPQSGTYIVQPQDLTPTHIVSEVRQQLSGIVFGFNISFSYQAVGNSSLASSLSVKITDPRDSQFQVGRDRTDYLAQLWPGSDFETNTTGFYSAVIWFDEPTSFLSGDGTWAFLFQNYDATYYSRPENAAYFTDITLLLNFGGGTFWPSPTPRPETLITFPPLNVSAATNHAASTDTVFDGKLYAVSITFTYSPVGNGSLASDLQLKITSPSDSMITLGGDNSDYSSIGWSNTLAKNASGSYSDMQLLYNNDRLSGDGDWSFQLSNAEYLQYFSDAKLGVWTNITITLHIVDYQLPPAPPVEQAIIPSTFPHDAARKLTLYGVENISTASTGVVVCTYEPYNPNNTLPTIYANPWSVPADSYTVIDSPQVVCPYTPYKTVLPGQYAVYVSSGDQRDAHPFVIQIFSSASYVKVNILFESIPTTTYRTLTEQCATASNVTINQVQLKSIATAPTILTSFASTTNGTSDPVNVTYAIYPLRTSASAPVNITSFYNSVVVSLNANVETEFGTVSVTDYTAVLVPGDDLLGAPVPTQTPIPPPDSSSSSGLSTGAIIGIAVGGVLAVGVIAALVAVLAKKRRNSQYRAPNDEQSWFTNQT